MSVRGGETRGSSTITRGSRAQSSHLLLLLLEGRRRGGVLVLRRLLLQLVQRHDAVLGGQQSREDISLSSAVGVTRGSACGGAGVSMGIKNTGGHTGRYRRASHLGTQQRGGDVTGGGAVQGAALVLLPVTLAGEQPGLLKEVAAGILMYCAYV